MTSGRLALVAKCGECGTGMHKTFSRQAYEKGLVLVRCDGCGVRHLVADNIGWTGDGLSPGSPPSPVNLHSLYGSRLQTGSLSPDALSPDGSLHLSLHGIDPDLIDGLDQHELRALYAKASRRKT